MPIYEYACQFCGYGLEARQKFSDPPLHQCPACEKDGLERLISESSFALKGSGWYADGYGPSGKKKDNGSTATSTASTAKSDSKKSESTSSAKSDTSSSSTSSSAASTTKSD